MGGQSASALLLALAGMVALVVVGVLAYRAGRTKGSAEATAASRPGLAVLQGVIENSQMLTYVRSLEGRYLLANALFRAAVGKTEEELIGADTVILFGAELGERGLESDRAAMEGPHQFEVWMDGPDGPHCFESVKFPLYDADGEVYAIGGVSRDVTEMRLARRATERARDVALAASSAKSTFLAVMSHEIRTPLNAVIGMTDLLMDTDLDPHQQELMGTLRSGGDTLLEVINDIIDYSRLQSGELVLEQEPFDLPGAAVSCLNLVASTTADKGLDVVCWVDPTCPRTVVGDGGRLRQMLVSLLSNAVKFTAAGDVLMTIRCAPEQKQLRAVVTVADTGIGIPADSFRHLFQSFSQVDTSSTRAYGGSGLGLAISQQLANAMGGLITVSSEPGVGSVFTLEVRLDPFLDNATADPTPSSPSVAAVPEAAGTTTRTTTRTTTPATALTGVAALAVDENPTALRILAIQLQSLGMSCTTAATPQEALSVAQEGGEFTFVILGNHPPGTDGAELAAALRQIPSTGDTKLVRLTSPASPPPRVDDSFDAWMAQPVRRAALFQTLTALVTGRPSNAVMAASPDVQQPQHRQPLRVLLAEDNLVNQRVAQTMLRRLGHEVDTVADGVEAVEAVISHRYDIVLMDLQMPNMDGIEATRQIRELLPPERQPYITAITASTLIMDRDACRAAGMESYLTKPVRVHELEDMLSRARTLGFGAGGPSSGVLRADGCDPEGELGP